MATKMGSIRCVGSVGCVLRGDHIRRLMIFAVVTHVILSPIWLFSKPVLAVSYYFVSIDTDLFDLLL